MSISIGDITQSLHDLLIDQQNPPGQFDVNLQSPADEVVDLKTGPQINLFLFRVTENIFLHNNDWAAEGPGTLRYPPLALNLFYVLTPFAQAKVDEHRVLGEAMRIFHDFPIVQGADLRGTLEDTPEQFKIDLVQLAIEDLTRIWTALAKPYRLSVGYEVRTAVIDSSVSEQVSRVTQVVTQFTQGGG
jgi:hypothetical protein